MQFPGINSSGEVEGVRKNIWNTIQSTKELIKRWPQRKSSFYVLTFSSNWPEVMRIKAVSFAGYRISKERLLGIVKV